MEWLIWMLIAFVLFRMIGFSCPTGRLGAGRRRRADQQLRSGKAGPGAAESGTLRGPRRPGVRLAESSETPMESLQRRFVDGRITIEEYEAELDRIFARSPRAVGDIPQVN